MANSGGGWILFGIEKKDNKAYGWDPAPVLYLDPAQLTDKVAAYTGEQFGDFEMQEGERDGHHVAALQIGAVSTPMVFIKPGTYDIGSGKQKTAFARGTVYFRHGAKSEPGNSKDLRDFVQREIERTRKSWLGGIRQVVTAPAGHQVKILPPEVVESPLETATRIRIVDDPSAPAYRKINPDQTHPYRQTELVKAVNQRLEGKKKINGYDIYCIREMYDIDGTKPQFYYKSVFASPQYSPAFVDWIVEQFKKNTLFFDEVRERFRQKQ